MLPNIQAKHALTLNTELSLAYFIMKELKKIMHWQKL